MIREAGVDERATGPGKDGFGRETGSLNVACRWPFKRKRATNDKERFSTDRSGSTRMGLNRRVLSRFNNLHEVWS